MKNFKYSEILNLNKRIGEELKSSPYNIAILSNITIHQIKEILEYKIRSRGINAIVNIGDYNNILQDSKKYYDSNAVFIFWELCNIIDGLQYKAEIKNKNDLDEILQNTKSEIDFIIKNLRNTSLVIMNKFTSISFSNSTLKKNNFEKLADHLNKYLYNSIDLNFRLVDLEKVIVNVGLDNCLDFRYYYSSKALYKIDFFKAYAEYVSPYIMSANGKLKKALIFDCDNTLWKGILGEDGFDNIEMSSRTKYGAIFEEIQSIALALNKKGILIGICSKNNFKDVNEVIKSHPDMQLREENIIINKSNWSNKVTNLSQIAKELNIGLESFVFIDDSSFEINLIKKKLPQITVLQVPKDLHCYPGLLRQNLGLFFNFSFTDEDSKKMKLYKEQLKRETIKKEFSDIEDYLSSLKLKVTIFEDDDTMIDRMSQMTQKTNQFNLTTKRYTERDILKFIEDNGSDVFAFSVSDKFGDYGITGLSIITSNANKEKYEIDTLLMSCRVIGRNIEYAFLDFIIEKIKKRKIPNLKARYIKTSKNEQVRDFFDNCSFVLIDEKEKVRNYILDVKKYNRKKYDYIKVVYD
ncbi:MAG: hypothetical protein CMG74_04350 [Candidatus Marinimicrobia bacterium]|nr:hypothetical protein [Candidatus Neomarinimicrobiota bacterium]